MRLTFFAYCPILVILLVPSALFAQYWSIGPQKFTGHEVPVLCYHQVRNYTPQDGSEARAYTVTPAQFEAQMKMLSDSGYHSILPDDLFWWYTRGKPLPVKLVMITFDDNTASQFFTARPILDKYGFKAVFFVMTVSLNRKNFMTTTQLKDLQQQGHAIGCHSWDHKNMREYTDSDWKIQLDQPLKTLETITGDSVRYFAFPYGVWTKDGLNELHKRGIQMAFILHTGKDAEQPLLTVRRLLVGGGWSANALHQRMMKSFLPF
jgi:peptidoglycan/xylan/chitin deacetylase (PgdA/CDA1 family)